MAWNNFDSLIRKVSLPSTAIKVERSMSVKPSAENASVVFLSIVSRQRSASWGSSNSLAWIYERMQKFTKVKNICIG